ncbi:MAG TPA: hypothetical protein VD978_25815 [Azospirillum sp.]|nr:hypothetical protein [Azospirillum sp.]
MIRSILILLALSLVPWGLSIVGTSLGIAVFPGPLLSSWVKSGASEEVAPNPDRPPADWLEAVYLARYPDVGKAVKAGTLRSGYSHYVLFGRDEGRTGAFAPAPLPAPPPAAAPPPVAVAVTEASRVPPPVAAPPQPQAPGPPAPSFPTQSVQAAWVAPPGLPGRKPAPSSVEISPPAAAPAPPAGSRRAVEPAVSVSGIRAGAHDGFTRIVLETNAPIRLGKPVQRDPRSLDVGLPNAVWQPARQGHLASRLLRYRVEATAEGGNRLLIDSDRAIRLKSLFSLSADGNRHHRLILDLAPGP